MKTEDDWEELRKWEENKKQNNINNMNFLTIILFFTVFLLSYTLICLLLTFKANNLIPIQKKCLIIHN